LVDDLTLFQLDDTNMPNLPIFLSAALPRGLRKESILW